MGEMECALIRYIVTGRPVVCDNCIPRGIGIPGSHIIIHVFGVFMKILLILMSLLL